MKALEGVLCQGLRAKLGICRDQNENEGIVSWF